MDEVLTREYFSTDDYGHQLVYSLEEGDIFSYRSSYFENVDIKYMVYRKTVQKIDNCTGVTFKEPVPVYELFNLYEGTTTEGVLYKDIYVDYELLSN